MAVLFVVLLMIVWKWEFLDSGSKYMWEGVSIGTQNELLYNQYGWLRNNIWMYNEYGEAGYDTIKYDLDIDGFVDLKTVDIDDDGEVDDIIVYTYNLQKILSLLLLLVFIVVIYVFSDGGKKEESKKENKDDIKEKEEWNASKKEKWKALVASIALIGILLSQGSTVYAVTQKEVDAIIGRGGSVTQQEYDLITLMGGKKLEILKRAKTCIDTWICVDIPTPVTSFYNNYKDDEWSIKYYSDFLRDAIVYCADRPNSCGANNSVSYSQIERTLKNIVLWVDNNSPNWPWKGITVDETEEANEGDDMSEFWTQDDIGVTTTTIITDENEIRTELWEDLLPVEDNSERDDISENNSEEKNTGTEGSETGETITIPEDKTDNKKNGGSIIEEFHKKNGERIKKERDDFFKWVKLINDTSWVALGGINNIKNIWKNMDSNTIQGVANIFGDLIGRNRVKSIDNLLESGKKLKDGLLEIGWKTGKILKWLGFIGDAVEWYKDYQEISKKHKWNSNKIFAESTLTITWKTLIGLNPYDVSLSILSWITHFAWYEEEAKVFDEFKISERYEEVVEIWSDEQSVSINQVINDASSDFFKTYNDPNVWVGTKSLEYIKLTSIIGAWAVWAIAWEALSTFTSWVGAIKSWF